MWPVSEACTVGLVALNPEVSWEKTDPASSTRSDKKGLNDNNSRLLGIVNKFCIPFGTKNEIVICWGSTVLHCSDPSPNCQNSELSTLSRILNKPGGV